MPKNAETIADEILVGMICGQEKDRYSALRYIYEQSDWRKEAMSKLRQQGVDEHDAKDVVQDALIILDRKVRGGKFELGKSLKLYFLGICTKRAYSNKRGQKQVAGQSEMPIVVVSDTPETEMLKDELKGIVRKLLDQLDDNCRDLLTYYMLSFSMREIRDLLGIKSDVMTRKMALICRQKLASLIDNSPTMKRFLKN